MSRKVEDVRVPSWEGASRDAGKVFRITEASALRGARWADRVVAALAVGTGATLPYDLAGRGMEAIAIFGINVIMQSTAKYPEIEPLLDELLGCVQVVRDPAHPEVATALIPDADIEEVRTVYWLRSEVLRIHTNFSVSESLSALISSMTAIIHPPVGSANT